MTLLAISTSVGAVFLQLAAGKLTGFSAPLLFLYPALLIAALFGGFKGGTISLATSVALFVAFGPDGSAPFELTPARILVLGVFTITGLAGSYVFAELHATRMALIDEKERYRTTLSSIADAVIATDHEGRVRLLNSEAERLTGWTAREAEGRYISEVLTLYQDDGLQRAPDPAAAVLRTHGALATGHTILRGRHGQRRYVEDSAAPIFNQAGNVAGTVVVFRDVSERRRSARLLAEHARDLEERVEERTSYLRQALSDMENFSYSVSHDLRAPLRAIRNYAEFLQSDHGHEFTGDARRYLERIHKNVQRVDDITVNLLEFARLSATQVENGPVDLNAIVREVISGLRQYDVSGVDIRVDQPLPWVDAHPAVLQQALRNLAENAIKFVPKDRRPTLHIFAKSNDYTVKLHVVDNGVGIAREDAKRVFKMFERLRPEEFPGTGIGLAIVHRAVQKCNGRIGFESEPGHGSTFWIEMRRCENPNAAVPSREARVAHVHANAGEA